MKVESVLITEHHLISGIVAYAEVWLEAQILP